MNIKYVGRKYNKHLYSLGPINIFVKKPQKNGDKYIYKIDVMFYRLYKTIPYRTTDRSIGNNTINEIMIAEYRDLIAWVIEGSWKQ